MRLRRHLAVALCAVSAGCGADRATRPDDAAQAAAELERAAAEMGFTAGPAGALAFQSAATALRGGARVTQVDITVDGKTERWNAFGHEIQIDLPSGTPAADFEPPPPIRALLAWRATPSGMRVIHLLAATDDGELEDPFAVDASEPPMSVFPSLLLYSEGRNLHWQAVRGHQTSSVARSTTPCPMPRRPAGAPPAPTCVEATFTFGLSAVEATPFVLPIAPGLVTPNSASGTRTLSMAPQTVSGVSTRHTIAVIGRLATAGDALP